MSDLDLLTEELIETIADRAAELALEKLSARRPANASLPAGQASTAAQRDLEAELATLLATRPSLTVPEIGQALRTRHEVIRRTLETSRRFASRSGLSGRSPKAKGWFLAGDSSPADPAGGTSPPDPTPDGAST